MIKLKCLAQSFTTSQSQDDFPPVAELLGISPPPQPAPRPAGTSTEHIKATTFNGKTIWMKRKLALPKAVRYTLAQVLILKSPPENSPHKCPN